MPRHMATQPEAGVDSRADRFAVETVGEMRRL